MKRTAFIFGLFLLVGVLTFANGLSNEFCIDDHAFFDEKMRNLKYLPYQFLPDKNLVLKLRDQQADAYYRPLAHVVPMLVYAVFGSNVVGHHAVNMVLFSCAAFLLFIFLRMMLKDELFALAAALLYLIHPINGVTVNYITANVFSVQVICMLASLIFLRQGRRFLSVIFFLLGVMCHETAMALPFYALALGLCVLRLPFKQALSRSIPLWIALFLYFIFRLKFASLGSSILGNFVQYKMSVFEYVASMAKLLLWYLAKLVYPVNIILIKALPVVRHNVGAWVLVFVGLVAMAAYLLWACRKRTAILLGLSWMIIGFLPFTQATLFRPSHGLMIEPHWFTFPVIGFFIIVADLVVRLRQRRVALGVGAFVVLLLTWGAATLGMNRIWSNEIYYCHYWLNESPGFSAPMFYLAKAYEVKTDYKNARVWYEKALEKNYQPYGILTNLGLLDIMEGKLEDAKMHLNKGLELNYMMPVAVSNLGTVAFMQEDFPRARDYFLKAIEQDRFALLPRLNLGRTLFKLGDHAAAVKTYKDILVISPGNEAALTAILKIHLEDKDQEGSLWAARSLLAAGHNPETLVNCGIIFERTGLTDEAAAAYRKAVAIAPAYRKATVLLQRLNP